MAPAQDLAKLGISSHRELREALPTVSPHQY
jgi:hypothetical protein